MTVLKIGDISVGGDSPTRLIASFWRKTAPEKLRELKNCGLDIAEIRLDLCDAANRTAEFVREFSAVIPTLATIRLKSEGGQWSDSEDARLAVFRNVIPAADAIDIELSARTRLLSHGEKGFGKDVGILDAAVASAKSAKKIVIISVHDFQSLPADEKLKSACDDAFNSKADIFKLAATINDKDSCQRLARFVGRISGDKKPFAVMGMGKFGEESRRCLIHQNALIYVCVDGPTVPGQIKLDEAAAMLGKSSSPPISPHCEFAF